MSDRIRVEMKHQVPNILHLHLGVVEDDHGIIRGAAEKVGSPDHGEIVMAHFCNRLILFLSNHLQERDKEREREGGKKHMICQG